MNSNEVILQLDEEMKKLKENISALEEGINNVKKQNDRIEIEKQERIDKAIEELMEMSNLLNFERIAGVSANAFAVINPWLWKIIEILDPDIIDRD